MELNASLLRKILKEAAPSAPRAETAYRPACVFLLFFNLETPRILAIQKSDTEGYPWRNQVALPGGHESRIVTPRDAAVLASDADGNAFNTKSLKGKYTVLVNGCLT